MNMYDVSVIMYVKDSQKYLEESLNSIIHQSLESMEIIFLYEKSCDASLNVLKAFSKKYPNMQIKEVDTFSTKEILESIKMADGEYLLFVDSFNIIKEDILRKFHNKIKEDQSDVLLFGLNDSVEDKVIKRISQLVGNNAFAPSKIREYLLDTQQTLYNKIFRKSYLVKELDLYDMFVQTPDNISILSLLNSQKISLMDESLYETDNPSKIVVDDRSFAEYVDSQNIFLNLLNKGEYSDYRIKGINRKFSDIIDLYGEVPVRYKKASYDTLRNYCLNYLKQKENNLELFTDTNRKSFEQIIISESVEEYELLKKVNEEKKSVNFMRRYEKIISVEHKKIKNFNDNLRNSRSWKLTGIFRLRNKL